MHQKKQHFVPATYLKAWCDSNSPNNYQPYVWVFNKNGGEPKKKSPEKILNEVDFYSIKKQNGERDLAIENFLSRIENEFTILRDKKIRKRIPLTIQDESILCVFAAGMYARTKARKNHLREQWQQILDLGNRMKEWLDTAPLEQVELLKTSIHPINDKKHSLNMDEIEYITKNPIQIHIGPEIKAIATAMLNMKFVILDTVSDPIFITSDNPCSWIDPDLFKTPTPFGAGGLISPDLEISLPISPTQCLFFGKKLFAKNFYIPIRFDNPLTTILNDRTYIFSDDYIISNQKDLKYNFHSSK